MVLVAAAPLAIAEEITPWRTCFQTARAWTASVDIQSDTVLVYGVNDSLRERVRSWAEQGYRVELMTGVAWGEYQDYVEGRFDGVEHRDEAQVRRDGTPIMHHATVPYFVPSATYRAYLKHLLAKAIDAGVTGIHLEEPEFWAFGGYSEAFKREYQQHYGQPWTPPHESVDARWKTARLQQQLYRDTLRELFVFSKQYAESKGRSVRCYVPTHSLVSYAQIRMVSPMASLMAMKEADGYIAQVWTGTARATNVYNGVARSRTFEAGFLEYAQMISMVRPTGRTCILLADPVEDDPQHGWDDYEEKYKCVLVASLLQPDAWHFETMPWPDRIFEGHYFATEADAARRNEPNPPPRVPMPPRYATTLLACINALNHMHAAADELEWDAGTRGVGVLISDSIMFQRDDPSPSDGRLSSFFGLAMPLVKHGLPAKVVQLETLTDTHALDGVDVLLMTYEGMKPPSPAFHDVLARWVREDGGGLIFVDDNRDPYNQAAGWWNTAPMAYATPDEHLLEKLGVEPGAVGPVACGKGVVQVVAESPAAIAHRQGGADDVRGWTRAVHAALKRENKQSAWREQNHLILRRGAFVIAATMDESVSAEPAVVQGRLVDLLDADLPVRNDPTLEPGRVGLYAIADSGAKPAVLASGSRIRDVETTDDALRFTSRGPVNTTCATRVRLPKLPARVTGTRDGQPHPVECIPDETSGTVLLRYANAAAPLRVECRW
ncbi:MAG: hypothetical protein JXA69_00735 [Phycisphaerae bacterium]|nr:hypothetical protein [Phycisphaerae bacterium]